MFAWRSYENNLHKIFLCFRHMTVSLKEIVKFLLGTDMFNLIWNIFIGSCKLADLFWDLVGQVVCCCQFCHVKSCLLTATRVFQVLISSHLTSKLIIGHLLNYKAIAYNYRIQIVIIARSNCLQWVISSWKVITLTSAHQLDNVCHFFITLQ